MCTHGDAGCGAASCHLEGLLQSAGQLFFCPCTPTQFNESKYLGFAVYNLALLSLVVIPLTQGADRRPTFRCRLPPGFSALTTGSPFRVRAGASSISRASAMIIQTLAILVAVNVRLSSCAAVAPSLIHAVLLISRFVRCLQASLGILFVPKFLIIRK